MIDVILSCPKGYTVSLTELASAGFTSVLKFDDNGQVTGISPRFNPLYPGHDDFNEPSLVYLRAEEKDIQPLLDRDWQETNVLAVCKTGGEYNETTEQIETLMGRLQADPDSFAEYLSYPATQVPEFDAEGEPNIMFPEFNSIEVDGETAQVRNPHYQPCLALGNFA